MATITRVLLRNDGPSFWPSQRPNDEVLELRENTPPHIWTATFQGVPTAPGGSIFKKPWWQGKNRYFADDAVLRRRVLRRWISWDTAGSLSASAAYTAGVVLEMLPDYRILLRDVVRVRVGFDDLLAVIEQTAYRYHDGKTASVVIEQKSTGLPAFQTMTAHAPSWLAEMLWLFNPTEDKTVRGRQAATWCAKDCVLLPHPSDEVPWLPDFETEFFDFPSAATADQVDAFSQGILAVSTYLETGWRARTEYAAIQNEQRALESAGIVRDTLTVGNYIKQARRQAGAYAHAG